jgi:chromosomal replication initiation ATPase DnaA
MKESIVDISLYEMRRRFPNKKRVTLEEIFRDMERVFGFNPVKCLSSCRKRHLVIYRSIFCYVTRVYCGFGLKEIGDFLNGRDHTTVYHSTQSAKFYILHNDPTFIEYWDIYITNSTLWKEHLSVKNI